MRKPKHILYFIVFLIFAVAVSMMVFPSFYHDIFYRPQEPQTQEPPLPEAPPAPPAEVAEAFDYEFSSNGNFYVITGLGTVEGSEIVIPEKIGAIDVKEIGYEAFKGCTQITSIVIPESVRSIDERAFFGCTALTSVNIPANIKIIHEDRK